MVRCLHACYIQGIIIAIACMLYSRHKYCYYKCGSRNDVPSRLNPPDSLSPSTLHDRIGKGLPTLMLAGIILHTRSILFLIRTPLYSKHLPRLPSHGEYRRHIHRLVLGRVFSPLKFFRASIRIKTVGPEWSTVTLPTNLWYCLWRFVGIHLHTLWKFSIGGCR